MKAFSCVVIAALVLVFAGCASSGSSADGSATNAKAAKVELPPDPDLDIDDIGKEWTLYLDRTLSESWSDGDGYSRNPPKDVAEGAENADGAWDFTFTKYNQRIIFALTKKQIEKVKAAAEVEVIIDGEASGSNKYRYHIGDSELGADWNATISFDEAEFASILTKTIKMNKAANVKTFMIQSRGADTRVAFPAETVTIRSITFICK